MVGDPAHAGLSILQLDSTVIEYLGGLANLLQDVPDRLEIAEAAAEPALSTQSITTIFALWAKLGLALLAVQKGNRSAAEEHYAFLLGQRGTMISSVSSVGRLLGLLSHTVGNTDQAAGHFEDGLAFCRQAGFRPELAWTRCDYADLLLERASRISARTGSDEDRRKAMSLLDESLAFSSELGMRPLMWRVLPRREILEA